MTTFPEHWRTAARNTGITLPEHLLETLSRRFSHILIEFDVREHRDWASTSLMSDFLSASPIEKKFGLPKGSVSEVVLRYISLSPKLIPRKDFHGRYPDVPYDQAHEFVLLHELGHCVKGSKEDRADEYAFARLLLPQDHQAKAARALWYEKAPVLPWDEK